MNEEYKNKGSKYEEAVEKALAHFELEKQDTITAELAPGLAVNESANVRFDW